LPRHRTEKAIMTTNYENLFESMIKILATIKINRKIKTVNQVFPQLLGWTLDNKSPNGHIIILIYMMVDFFSGRGTTIAGFYGFLLKLIAR
jgi:hypothetical protein